MERSSISLETELKALLCFFKASLVKLLSPNKVIIKSIISNISYLSSYILSIYSSVDIYTHTHTHIYIYIYIYIWNFDLKIDFKIQTCLFTLARFSASKSLRAYINIYKNSPPFASSRGVPLSGVRLCAWGRVSQHRAASLVSKFNGSVGRREGPVNRQVCILKSIFK